ncbi:hypothetical protein [Staphylococcus epidermidis]|uniref:hypothetical protein n=1 Tax=Staphylococcus epidermidis TaxID=1282 RepID=UPI003C79E48B
MSNNKICDVICVHEENVYYALRFLKEEEPQRLSNILLMISDENKLKVILALIKELELGVCVLSVTLGLSIASKS